MKIKLKYNELKSLSFDSNKIQYLRESSKRFVKAGNNIINNPLVQFKEYYDALELLLKSLYVATSDNKDGDMSDPIYGREHKLNKIYEQIMNATGLELISKDNLDIIQKYGNIHITVPYGGKSAKAPDITEQDIKFVCDLIENLKKSYKKIKKTVEKKKDKKLKLKDINYDDYNNELWNSFSSKEDYDF